MRRWVVVGVALAMAACSTGQGDGTTTTTISQPTTTTTSAHVATTSLYTDSGRLLGGQMVKLDLETLTPVLGAEPIPLHLRSWNLTSDDGGWVVVFDWATATPIDVSSWEPTGTFDLPAHTARVVDGDQLYMYVEASGEVRVMDLRTGEVTTGGVWPSGLFVYHGLVALPDGRVAALAPASSNLVQHPATYSVYLLDPATGATGEIEIGTIERHREQTGIFAGEYEISESDTPGIVWGQDRLYIVYGDGPEVTAADLDTGEVQTHSMDRTTWLDRLLAFWMPSASAKGPSLGTHTNAALSPDGRFLIISGDRYETREGADGGLIEEVVSLGLTVVDTETWQVVDQPDLPFQSVRNAGETILGADLQSTSPWVEDVYALSIDDEGTITHVGPFTVEEGRCQPAKTARRLTCIAYVTDATQRLSVLDMETGETTTGPEVGREDYLEGNGVLVDRRPLTGSLGE